jgi:hypothetical protein
MPLLPQNRGGGGNVKRRGAILALAVGTLTVSPIASADNDERGEENTFEGSCQFSGELRQRPPLTNTPQPGEGVARAYGTCSGTLTDDDGDAQRLESDRARYFASAQGTLSCAGGSAAGSGFIQVSEARLHFGFSEVRGPGAAAIRLDGASGGSAAGEARVSDEEHPLEIAEKCSAQGLRRVQIDLDIATTPAITG